MPSPQHHHNLRAADPTVVGLEDVVDAIVEQQHHKDDAATSAMIGKSY